MYECKNKACDKYNSNRFCNCVVFNNSDIEFCPDVILKGEVVYTCDSHFKCEHQTPHGTCSFSDYCGNRK